MSAPPPPVEQATATRRKLMTLPAEARVAQARYKGFAWWQWRAMTLISGLPMFLFVMYAQLTQ